jgi:hypothetical protein
VREGGVVKVDLVIVTAATLLGVAAGLAYLLRRDETKKPTPRLRLVS